jgi:DNA modification methylase
VALMQGDARSLPLADDSVQCVVTSPPYWGLRDYGLPPSVWDDGWRGVLGLEPTPELWLAHMVSVFREIRRVLRDDGTVWCNVGDAFAQKQLLGLPWRVAFALQADGWYLRADVIWAKPNPMPESVTDRPTKAHEYVFLLAKRERYFYDAEAVKETSVDPPGVSRGGSLSRFGRTEQLIAANAHRGDEIARSNGHRNRRSVWTVATEPYPEAHFATFPEALVAPCILAGTSERGACQACGAPWERTTDTPDWYKRLDGHRMRSGTLTEGVNVGFGAKTASVTKPSFTTGWRPTCACHAPHVCTTYCLEQCDGRCLPQTRPCLVLDPFAGSGTVGAVAERLGRRWVGVDLKPDYLAMAKRRTAQMGLVFSGANGHTNGHHRVVEVAGAL